MLVVTFGDHCIYCLGAYEYSAIMQASKKIDHADSILESCDE
jgi:hypothetical protein